MSKYYVIRYEGIEVCAAIAGSAEEAKELVREIFPDESEYQKIEVILEEGKEEPYASRQSQNKAQ